MCYIQSVHVWHVHDLTASGTAAHQSLLDTHPTINENLLEIPGYAPTPLGCTKA